MKNIKGIKDRELKKLEAALNPVEFIFNFLKSSLQKKVDQKELTQAEMDSSLDLVFAKTIVHLDLVDVFFSASARRASIVNLETRSMLYTIMAQDLNSLKKSLVGFFKSIKHSFNTNKKRR